MSKSKSWDRHMRSYERSGASKKEYCEKHSLNIHTFDYWRSKLRKNEDAKFVKVESDSTDSAPVEIELGDMLIRVPEDFSKAALETILEVASARN